MCCAAAAPRVIGKVLPLLGGGVNLPDFAAAVHKVGVGDVVFVRGVLADDLKGLPHQRHLGADIGGTGKRYQHLPGSRKLQGSFEADQRRLP